MNGDVLVVIIVIVNIPALIVGLAFAIFGGIVLWSRSIVQKLTSLLAKPLAEIFEDKIDEPFNTLRESIIKIASFVGIVLLVVGLVMIFLAILSFVGVGCYNWVLIVYAALLGAIVIANIAVVIVCFNKSTWRLDDLHTFLKKQVMAYVSSENGDAASLLMGAIMRALKCCGYNNGSDFAKPGANFSRRDVYDEKTYTNLEYPVWCCKPNVNYYTTYAKFVYDRNAPFYAEKCPEKFIVPNSNIEIGCKNAADEAFGRIYKFAGYFLIATLIVIVILFGLTVLLVYARRHRT